MKLAAFLLGLGAAALAPASASAFEIVTVGVGAQFNGGGNFFDKPADQQVHGFDVNDPNINEYPGFAGVAIGGGGFVDVRFIEIVGFEFGVLYQSDKGTASITRQTVGSNDQTKFDITIKHNAVHMPLLIKGVIPGKIAQPFLFVGPEFVVPTTNCPTGISANDKPDCHLSEDQGNVKRLQGTLPLGSDLYIQTKKYVMVTFGLGVEFKLPIPQVDMRIPLSLRGSVTPSASGRRDPGDGTGREVDTCSAGAGGSCAAPNAIITRTEYYTNWKFQASANLGISFHF